MSEHKTSESPITPLGDRVIVRPLAQDEFGAVSPSGIIIPDTAKKEKPEQGVVIAVGSGKWNEDGDKRLPLDVKVGDRIIFSKYGYDEVKIDDKEYFIVGENSILGVFNK
jgi:chaperonin GroES